MSTHYNSSNSVILSDATLAEIIELGNKLAASAMQLEEVVWAMAAEANAYLESGSESYVCAFAQNGLVEDLSKDINTRCGYSQLLWKLWSAGKDLRNRAVHFNDLNADPYYWDVLNAVFANRQGGSGAPITEPQYPRVPNWEASSILRDDSLAQLVEFGNIMLDGSKAFEMQVWAMRAEAFRQLNEVAKRYIELRKKNELTDECVAALNDASARCMILGKLWKIAVDVRNRSGQFGDIDENGPLWEALSTVFANRRPDPYATKAAN